MRPLAWNDPLPARPHRILVAGTSGAGKTTVAAALSARLGIPHTDIDGLYHGPGWTPRPEFGTRNRPPQGNGGLYSTGPDYARFCRMLLNGGTLDGRRYLSAAAMKFLTTSQTADLPTGFFQNDTYGNRGANYGWGIATCILRAPHEGVAAMLSPGTYGHGGAWGTQAWIDPVKGVAYVLMVQRSNFPNSDASEVRREFQQAAAAALAKK